MRLTVILAALCAVLFASNADARSRHHRPVQAIDLPFFGLFEAPQAVTRLQVRRQKVQVTARTPPVGLRRVMAEGAGRVVSHPAGCPARSFCGCGASVRVFGRPVRSLWLARNWYRFPRTSPAPGTVAVRRHHVFVLERHISGSNWMVYDANSGRHRTRVHSRSIAGYQIVDPSSGA